MTGERAVGDHVLVVGGRAGTVIRRAEQTAPDHGLAKALDADPALPAWLDARVTPIDDFTAHIEKGVALAEKLAAGLDPGVLEDWLGPTLNWLEAHDEKERFEQAFELVRVTQRVLALARRWLELVKLLLDLLRRARAAGDQPAIAWAQHELGTLDLAAGRLREADARLEDAWKLGDRQLRAVTEQSLRMLCGQLRETLRKRPPTRGPRRALLVVLSAVLLLIGGLAGAALGKDDPPAEQEPTAATATASHSPKPTRTAKPKVTARPAVTAKPAITARPTVTPKPAITARPTVTPKPAITAKPAVTAAATETATASPTDTPVATETASETPTATAPPAGTASGAEIP